MSLAWARGRSALGRNARSLHVGKVEFRSPGGEPARTAEILARAGAFDSFRHSPQPTLLQDT